MKVLVLGQGELGWRTVQILAHSSHVDTVIAVDVNPRQAGRTQMVRHSAQLLGLATMVEFATLDALDQDAVEQFLAAERPDIIVNTASLQSWYVIQQLPAPLWETLHGGGLGIWLPAHLAPAAVLMKALRNVGHRPFVVNMAFADAVNVMLNAVGLGPDLGAGNIEELAVAYRDAVARQYAVPLHSVRVRMVGHHWVNAAVLESRQVSDIPLIVRTQVDGRDVGGELDVEQMLLDSTADFPPGFEDTWLIAASAAHKVLAVLGHGPEHGHATAIDGNPGGYPVLIRDGAVQIDLPPDVSLDEARRVNLEGQLRDGIERITDEGVAVLSDHARSVMKDVLGWDYSQYGVDDAPEMALEISRRYREFATKVLAAA